MEAWWLVGAAVALAILAVVLLLVARRRRAAPAADRSAAVPAATRLWDGLAATRARLGGQLDAVLRRGGDVDAVLPALEEALVAADVGVRTAADLVGRVHDRAGAGAPLERVRAVLREEVAALLATGPPPAPTVGPHVILVLGVNGVGKTTTIGKLAALHRAAGRKVLMVAGDTFRAAAGEQLAVWAERTGAELVRQAAGANPAAVAFDGMKAAVAREADVVLVDTAGRLHTRANLMEELRKVERVISREIPGAPHETLLVLDATTGQNGIAQARTFAEALSITGVVLTKLDGTARGGVALAVRKEVGVPIRWIGVGEQIDDLRSFDPDEFAGALLEPEDAAARDARTRFA
jgi:fused signal recognition particle receptor